MRIEKDVPYGKEIKKIINVLISVSKKDPNKGKQILAAILGVIEDGLVGPPQPSGYVALLGIVHGSKSRYQQIALRYHITELRFFDDLDHLKNGKVVKHLRSTACKMVVVGQMQHSIRNVSEIVGDKFVEARDGRKRPKITYQSFENVLKEIAPKAATG